jgi:uncharacterized protein YecE (DUF72 family)
VEKLHIGCSGYSYAHWKNRLYKEVPQPQWLGHYARIFRSVELNNTFYRLPTPSMVEGWRQQTPPGFRFAAKGSRFITHMKRLREPKLALQRYFERADLLGKKLACVLWQLPPQMTSADLPRLESFLAHLPGRVKHAFEFRAEAWYTLETCDLLDGYGAAFCEHDLVQKAAPRITGDFRYLRFHGATGKYRGRYGKAALAPYALDLRRWERSGKEAFVYFNNDLGGHAVRDALDLIDLVETGRSASRPARYESRAPRSPLLLHA